MDFDERKNRVKAAAKRVEMLKPVDRPVPLLAPPFEGIPSVTGIEPFGQRPSSKDSVQAVEIYDPARMTPWVSNARPLQYLLPTNARYGPTAGVFFRGIWQTPLFDLRGDIGMQQGIQGNTSVMARETRLPEGFRLHLQIKNLGAVDIFPDLFNTRVYSQEFGAAFDPNTSEFFQDRRDITSDVNAGYRGITASGTQVSQVILRWRPEGNLRYWGVAVIVDYLLPGPLVGWENTVFSAALH